MSKVSPHEARNAYSALLLIPGWESLRFVQLIKLCKREWGTSVPKYADFWDAKTILGKILCEPLNWHDVQQVRDRAIILLRLLHLCRSIDLARSWRRKSQDHSHQVWLWLQRKGARRPTFEKLMNFSAAQPSLSLICPTAVLLQYVKLTSALAKPGSKLFLSLKNPFRPLSASTIGGITKRILQKLGVPMSIFGAHSTRGAAVKMFKSLGLSSEVVCELGRWKNPTAFTAHYLRLNAASKAQKSILERLVHRDPSSEGAEQDRSCSPERPPEPGRSDLYCGAHEEDGPTQTQPKERSKKRTKPRGGDGTPSSDKPRRFEFAKTDNCRLSKAVRDTPGPKNTQ